MKYKVGDKVRIVSKWVHGCNENPEGRMDKWLGKVMTIRAVDCDCYLMEEDKHERLYGWHWFEPAIAGLAETFNHKIIITSDGKETLARMYDGKTVVKSAKAICCPDDTFDFKTGAELAFDRLIRESPKYYNGKVVCISELPGFTKGKVYEFKNGYTTSDDGDKFPHVFPPMVYLEYCYLDKYFIPLVE